MFTFCSRLKSQHFFMCSPFLFSFQESNYNFTVHSSTDFLTIPKFEVEISTQSCNQSVADFLHKYTPRASLDLKGSTTLEFHDMEISNALSEGVSTSHFQATLLNPSVPHTAVINTE